MSRNPPEGNTVKPGELTDRQRTRQSVSVVKSVMANVHPLYCSVVSADSDSNPGFMLFPDLLRFDALQTDCYTPVILRILRFVDCFGFSLFYNVLTCLTFSGAYSIAAYFAYKVIFLFIQ